MVKIIHREEIEKFGELRKQFYKMPAAKTSDSNDIFGVFLETELLIELPWELLNYGNYIAIFHHLLVSDEI